MQRILRTCGNHSAGNNIEVFYNVFSFFSFTLGFSFFFKKRKLGIKTPLLNHIKSSTGFQLIAKTFFEQVFNEIFDFEVS